MNKLKTFKGWDNRIGIAVDVLKGLNDEKHVNIVLGVAQEEIRPRHGKEN